jgi:hypothetical protein
MSALVLSAAEQRIFRAVVAEADRQDMPVTHRQVQMLARVAARAAVEPRPADREAPGPKGREKAPGGRSERRRALADGATRPGAATEAPGAVSVVRGVA